MATRTIEQGPSYREPLPSSEKSTRPKLGFGKYWPERILDNYEIASWEVVRKSSTGEPWSEKDFTDITGIKSRRIAGPRETLLKMGLDATQQALDSMPGTIDCVFVTTNFPTGVNLSAEIAKEFGITGFNMDFYAGCAGFGGVLHSIKEIEKYFLGKRILFVDTQRIHDHLRDLRNNTGKDGKPIDQALQQVLFTDGANAMIVDYGKDFTVIFSKLHLIEKDEEGKIVNDAIKLPIDKSLVIPPAYLLPVPYTPSGFIEQNGHRVFKFMCKNVPQLVRRDLKDYPSIKKLDIHQASGPVVDFVIKAMPEYEIGRDCKDGNPSSGTLPKRYRDLFLNNEIKIGDERKFAVYGAGYLAVTGVVKFGDKA